MTILSVPPTASSMTEWVRGAARAINQLIAAEGVAQGCTVATLPAPEPAGRIVFVADESGGAVLAYSDGADWRRVTDRAIVS